jgi:hypothetical protein
MPAKSISGPGFSRQKLYRSDEIALIRPMLVSEADQALGESH